MANENRFGQKGVSTDLQFGKRGPKLVANASTSSMQVMANDGVTLANVRIADGVIATDAVSKQQMEAALAVSTTNAYNITLGTGGDGDLVSPGAVTSLTSSTSVTESIDRLNETMENIRNNTYVKSVDATSNVSSGGDPLTVTLTLSVVGNANQYDIVWGDGNTTTATSDSTPSHTYTDNTNSPYDIVVTASNSSGSGSGSSASKTRTDYVTLYTATPVANFEIYTSSAGGSALTGNSREIDSGETLYLDNITTNSASSTNTHTVDWGDGSSVQTVAAGAAGDVGQARLSHTYSSDSGSSRYTITLTQTAHSTAAPSDLPHNATDQLKVYDPAISAPSGLSSKSLVFAESSTGTSPRAASSFTDNISGGGQYTAGDSVVRITNSSAGSTTSTNIISTFASNGDSGTLEAHVDNALSSGSSITKSISSDTGTAGDLILTAESDYQFLSTSGSSTSFSSSIFSPGLFQGFKAQISTSTVGLTKGEHSFQLKDSGTGDTNVISFFKDDLESTATVSMSNANLVQATVGTLKYVSGIPYYTDDATLTLSGVEVYDWIGQAYTNSSNPLTVTNGTNQESTSASTVSTQSYSYSNIDGATTFLSGGIPIAETGKTSATAYTLGSLTVDVDGNGTGIEQIKARMLNVNGNSPYAELTGKYVQAWNSTPGIDEEQITVSDSLGAGFNDDGKRITGFSSASDTPVFDNSVNNYTANAWTGAHTIAGTVEAVDRWGDIVHFDTDLSGTAYLPTGPDLNTGRSGAQYFTFAFRRTTMANFNITISGTVSGMFIAAPGTSIDSASGLNGWLDCGITYGGSGTPGSDTGAGGNGSNGCAFTSGDRITDGTSYSNSSHTMTLGDQNATGATGNNILVRIKLESGDSLTSLSIS